MKEYYEKKMKEAAMQLMILCGDTAWIEALRNDAASPSWSDVHDAKACVYRRGNCNEKMKADMLVGAWVHFYCELETLVDNK